MHQYASLVFCAPILVFHIVYTCHEIEDIFGAFTGMRMPEFFENVGEMLWEHKL